MHFFMAALYRKQVPQVPQVCTKSR